MMIVGVKIHMLFSVTRSYHISNMCVMFFFITDFVCVFIPAFLCYIEVKRINKSI